MLLLEDVAELLLQYSRRSAGFTAEDFYVYLRNRGYRASFRTVEAKLRRLAQLGLVRRTKVPVDGTPGLRVLRTIYFANPRLIEAWLRLRGRL